jgi:ABC-type iron transport system FetAB permease component
MISESTSIDHDRNVIPEIAVIKDILIGELKRSHEARLDRLEEQFASFAKDVEGKLQALALRIEAVAAESGQAQKKALGEIADAISQVAVGLKFGQGSGQNVSSE